MLSDDMNMTGTAVVGSGGEVSTGTSSGFNYGMLPSIINAAGSLITGIIGAVYQGKAVKDGTYYNRYNQGMYNSYNSGATSLFLIAGVVVVVVLLKNK